MKTILSLLATLGGSLLALPAADWPMWRGPNGLGVSAESGLPTEWSKDNNLAWTLKTPGKGASSPAVAEGRIYLTYQDADSGLHVLAIGAEDGKAVWDRAIGSGKLKAHELHNMATATAVAGDGWVWALFGTGDLACLDREGQVVWQRNLQKDHGAYDILWGMGTSPVRHGDSLFIAVMHQGPSYVLGVDTRTGKDVWKADRKLEAKGEALDSYSSPIIVPTDSGAEVVVSGADHINAYDPATGKQLWISGGLAVSHPYGRTISGPTAGEGAVVTVASGFQNRGRVLALRPGGRGDVTDSRRLWTVDRYAPDCPCPVVYGGKAYFIRDDGIASCVDLQTGEAHWQERLFKENVKVSPVAGDGKVYFTSGQGNCVVVKAGPRLDILATNTLDEPSLATPALSGGRIYLRTAEHLYAVKGSR